MIMNFDFNKKWEWKDLEKTAANEKEINYIIELKKIISIENARFLFDQLLNLNNPEEIKNLRKYQALQIEWGGSFYGIIPDQINEEDDIPIPTNFENLLKATIYLANIRNRNYEAIRNTGFPLNFKNKPFNTLYKQKCPANINFNLDISGIQKLLKLFDKDSIAFDEAMEIANHHAFREMIKHRHNLGYIPKPWITKESLASFIQHAISRKPLDMIWKWLNPWNFFNFADIFNNLEQYKKLINTIELNKENFVNQITSRIASFLPENIKFEDQFTFAIGWGIRGWATNATGGLNIEHFKDDYDLLIQTITHETFHRLQLEICPIDSSRYNELNRSFESIVSYSFPDNKDCKFYEVITYVFLEGSATFVGGKDCNNETDTHIDEGIRLLNQIYETIYSKNNLEKVDELVNKGLKSNGPFYELGYYMTEKIVNKYGNKKLGNCLLEGSTEFFKIFFEIYDLNSLENITKFNEGIKEKIIQLNKFIKNNKSATTY